MKKLLTACLPALALFALGGCAGTSALTSSEDDGVYYSSKDRTTAVVSTAPTSTNEAANPDYNGNANSPTARQSGSSDEYYDNSYTYMQGVQYTSPGVSYYTPYSPYTTLSYGMGSYGMGGFGGFPPYGAGFYDPFFDPFYSPFNNPFGYGFGPSISFGFGRPWGYGRGFGYGRSFGGYGFGYGNGFYDPYFYGGPFYGGYYGQGGYYGNNFYGNIHGNNGGYYGDNNGRGRTSGSRTYRSSDGRYQSGNRTSGTVSGTSPGGGRVRPDGLLNPAAPQGIPTSSEVKAATVDGGRTRTDAVTAVPSSTTRQERTEDSFNRPRRMDAAGQPRYRTMDQQAVRQQQMDATPARGDVARERAMRDEGQVTRDQPMREESRGRGNRWRNADAAPQLDQAQPENRQYSRRGRFSQDAAPQPRLEGNQQAPDQPRQRSYDQPRQQRTYEQPQQAERTYEQPQQRQQERTYEQPQRSESQPSYSAPSGGGGEGGGRSRGRND